MRDIGFGTRIRRLFIFGDSFADNYKINKKSGYVSPQDLSLLWTEKIKVHLNPEKYYNLGQCATGPTHTINRIKNINFFDNDLLIVILSFHDVDVNNLFEINLENQNYIHKLPAKTIVLHVYYNEKLSHPYTFPLSLFDISWNEIFSNYDDIKVRRWDKRVNHLSWCNHDILANCVLEMLGGNNKFFYDIFNFKFLKLDDAYHPDLYNSNTAFIYD